MTIQELLSTIQALPPTQQLELANTILDGLAESGTWPISDEMNGCWINAPGMQMTTRIVFDQQKRCSPNCVRR